MTDKIKQRVEKKIIKLFQDWGIEEIDNLITHLEPILKIIKEGGERVDRSYMYEKVIPELKQEQKEEVKKMIEEMKEDLNKFGFTDFALEIKEDTLNDILKKLEKL